jgi:hypothetical protein
MTRMVSDLPPRPWTQVTMSTAWIRHIVPALSAPGNGKGGAVEVQGLRVRDLGSYTSSYQLTQGADRGVVETNRSSLPSSA